MNRFADIDRALAVNGTPPAREAEVPPWGPNLPDSAYADDPDLIGPVRSSTFFRATDLAGTPVPERDWIVPGMVPVGAVTTLGGDGGTGKSLLALQLAVAMATGRRWLDRMPDAGNVLYISAEDERDELHRRLHDITQAEGLHLSDLERLSIRSLAGESALLTVSDARNGLQSATPLYDEIVDHAGEIGANLVVLDTLADLYPGNENDRSQAVQFLGYLRSIAVRLPRAAVLLLAHPSLSGLQSGTGNSGSTAWNNSVRSRLYFRRVVEDGGHEPDPDRRILGIMKANYGRIGEEIECKWARGAFIAMVETSIDRAAMADRAKSVFIQLLAECNAAKIRVNHQGGQNYAPNVFAAHQGRAGCTAPMFRSAMMALLAAGQIVVEEDGPPSKRRQFLVVQK